MKIALLIDAENTHCKHIEFVLEKAKTFGELNIRRVYGDFTRPQLSCWKELLQNHAMTVAQRVSYKKGKNTTDIEIIMDAIELKERKLIDGVVLVSGDSDFTGLATRMRENNLLFIGIGSKDASPVLKNACSEYIEFTEEISVASNHASDVFKIEAPKLIGPVIVDKINLKSEPISKINSFKIIGTALKATEEPDGYSYSGKIGEYLKHHHPNFNFKVIGYSGQGSFFKENTSKYKIDYRNNNSSLYIKTK